MVALLLEQRSELLPDGASVLHIAPEPALRRIFEAVHGVRYTACDLYAAGYGHPADVENVDITQAPYPDRSFDLIFCSHVLEHIPDDRRAMREMLRLLTERGHAMILVPVRFDLATTYEDASITDPETRRQAFGQHDHVRSYGRDFPAQLAAAGFAVEVIRLPEQGSEESRAKFGLHAREEIYLCRCALQGGAR